jgi:hypothetical protein
VAIDVAADFEVVEATGTHATVPGEINRV